MSRIGFVLLTLTALVMATSVTTAAPPSRYLVKRQVTTEASAPAANASVSAATPLPGDLTVAAATGKQHNVQIAKGTDTFLSVWSDTRSALSDNGPISVGGAGPYLGPGLGTMSDIYAARVDATGNMIDQHPIVVSQASYNQGKPQVAWNGQNWLVVWLEEQETSNYYFHIRAVRISAAGAVLDATPITLSPATQDLGSFPAAVVHDGTNWVVIWESVSPDSSSRSVYARRVSSSGAVVDAEPIAIHTHSSQYLTNPDIAFNGSGFLLIFRDMIDNKIYGRRYSQALQPEGGTFTINNYSPSKPTHVQVEAGGGNYFVGWDEHPVSGNVGSVRGCRVTSAGTVQDPGSIVIDGDVGTSESSPAVAWDGTRWSVAYDSGYSPATGNYLMTQDVYLKRVSTAGAVSPQNPVLVSTAASHQVNPAIAPGLNGAVQVVWDDARAEQDIYGASVSSAGVASNERAISLGAPRQSRPRMISGGGVVLSVFQREVAGSSHVFGQRLNADGTALDAQPFQLSATAIPTNRNPSVAFNGTHFFVVWDQVQTDEIGNILRKVYGRRVGANGTAIDAEPVLLMDGETPDVAALGDAFLTVAIRRLGQQTRNVEAVRVSGAGAVLGSPILLQGNYNFVPRVAALGNRWLAVWEYHSNHDVPRSWIRGAFVDSAGAATPTFQVAVSDSPYGTGNSYDDTPHLAVSGTEALIVWADNDVDRTDDIKGRRIDANGTLLGSHYGFVISNASGSQFMPAVSWDGSQYVATWLDQRDEQYPVQPRGDIYGARITPDGTVIDPSGFVVSNAAAPEETPFVASANGNTLFAYAAFYSGSPFSAMRVAVRRSAFTPESSLTSVTLPENAPRGSWLTGSVALSSAAPAGGTVVTLQSADPTILSVPAEVTVPAGATSASFAATTQTVEADTAVLVSATSAGITRAATVVVTATSTYAQWQQVHFPSGSAVSSAATADADSDGRSNFFEYATGSNPNAADAGPAFTSSAEGGYLSLIYSRRKGASDAAFTVRQSGSLTSWSDATPVYEIVDRGATETVTARVPINGATQLFLRLHLAQQ